jgi:sugar/nucleoside kinase (ribokinase family)
MPTAAYDVIACGHLCLDLLPELHNLPLTAFAAAGKTFEIGAVVAATGGSVANTGQALHILGAEAGFRVGLMSNVGDDLIGTLIIAALNARDPALSALITVKRGVASSSTLIMSPENRDRLFLYNPGPNRTFGIADVDFEVVGRSRLFHLGYPTILPHLLGDDGDELCDIFRCAHTAGCVTALDTSMPDIDSPGGRANWPRVLERTLPYVDIFVPSAEESILMLRRADYEAWGRNVQPHLTLDYVRVLADELLAMGVAVAGFKLGAFGLYLRTAPDQARLTRLTARLSLDPAAWAGYEGYHPAFSVDVAGTTGAGDSAYAALLIALLRSLDPDAALRMACAAGACNVEAIDAVSGLRSWSAIEARLAAGWAMRPERLLGA